MIFKDYKGRTVRLTEERIAHFVKRLVNAGLLEKLEETVADPDFVIESRTDAMAVIHYCFYRGTRAGDKYLCVVVKHNAADAYVLTAYPSDQIKKGRLIWERKRK